MDAERPRAWTRVRRTLPWMGSAVACVALYLAVMICTIYNGPLDGAPPGSMDRGENGVWMAHRWYDDTGRDPLSDDEIDRTCDVLKASRIRFLYVHVGPLDATGTLPAASPARWARVRERVHQRLPGVLLLAWMGGLNVRYEGRAKDTLDLDRPEVRAGIVREVSRLMAAGFAGVHYDIEPLGDHDRSFLALLEETQPALATRGPALLSVAAPLARPPFTPAVGPLSRLWTPTWYRLVSQRCDQIVVMAYDAYQPSAEAYSRFVRYQVRLITASVDCPIIVGLPAYSGEKTPSHDPAVESTAAGLRGLMAAGPDRRLLGAAVYAQWTARPDEWTTFQQTWCAPGGPAQSPPPAQP